MLKPITLQHCQSPPAWLYTPLQSVVGKQSCLPTALSTGDAPQLRCCCDLSWCLTWHKTCLWPVVYYDCSMPEAENDHGMVQMFLQSTCADAWLTNRNLKLLEVTANVLLAELWSANISVKKVQNVSHNKHLHPYLLFMNHKCQTVLLLMCKQQHWKLMKYIYTSTANTNFRCSDARSLSVYIPLVALLFNI